MSCVFQLKFQYSYNTKIQYQMLTLLSTYGCGDFHMLNYDLKRQATCSYATPYLQTFIIQQMYTECLLGAKNCQEFSVQHSMVS